MCSEVLLEWVFELPVVPELSLESDVWLVSKSEWKEWSGGVGIN